MDRRPPGCDISVIIPAFNAARYLAEAIESVLGQTEPPGEIIVVDDGSADGTAAIAKSYPSVRCIQQANGGVAAALNTGLHHVQTRMVSFLSADDIWAPQKLERQCALLAQHPGALVFGHMLHFISPDLSPEEAAVLSCPPEPMPAYSAGTLLCDLEIFRAVGPFSESFAVGEFIEWFGRANDMGISAIMPDDVVSNRRVHGRNHSYVSLKKKSYAPVLKALLDRRRAQKEEL